MNENQKNTKKTGEYFVITISVVLVFFLIWGIYYHREVYSKKPLIADKPTEFGDWTRGEFLSKSVPLNNNTPQGAAKMFLKAMIDRDAKLMKEINHSDINYPPSYCLQMATKGNWAQYDLNKFTFLYYERGIVECLYPDKRPDRLEIVEENGKWYFYGFR